MAKHPGGMLDTQRPGPGAPLGERIERYEQRMREMKGDPKMIRERLRDGLRKMRSRRKGLAKEALTLRDRRGRRRPGRDTSLSFRDCELPPGMGPKARKNAR